MTAQKKLDKHYAILSDKAGNYYELNTTQSKIDEQKQFIITAIIYYLLINF